MALKQSPRAWFDRFGDAMLKKEDKKSSADHTIYDVKREGYKTKILIVVECR